MTHSCDMLPGAVCQDYPEGHAKAGSCVRCGKIIHNTAWVFPTYRSDPIPEPSGTEQTQLALRRSAIQQAAADALPDDCEFECIMIFGSIRGPGYHQAMLQTPTPAERERMSPTIRATLVAGLRLAADMLDEPI